NAQFVNNNGAFVLDLQDGGGRNGGEISVGVFQGNSLSASIAPGVVSEFGNPTRIQINGDIDVAGAVSLTGNLSIGGPTRTIKGATSVNWTNEKTGGTIVGEGTVKFVEGTTVTRFG